MKTIFIDGEAGTTGLGIRQRLNGLPVAVVGIDPALRKDPAARRAIMAETDVVILCLPDEAAREAVALADSLGAQAPRLLDASSAHRVDPAWTYGFPELTPGQSERIAAARRVSNPGCYATGAIALLRPLVDEGLIPPDHPISINATSGYSGGGRQMIEAHAAEAGPAFELYGLGLDHKHVPEIALHARLAAAPLFVPSVGHFPQGMIVSIPLHLDRLPGGVTGRALYEALAEHYRGSSVAQVVSGGAARLRPDEQIGSDAMALHVYAAKGTRHAVLVARLDNLGKGASGAAVQNLRLMLGLPEEA